MTDDPPLRTDFGEVTLERLEKGVEQAALVVQVCGPEYAGIFERLERELYEFRQRQDPVARARAYLDEHGRGTRSAPAG